MPFCGSKGNHLDIFYILLRAITAVIAVIVLTRLNGLRSFSKMSGFDFAITVATGSVLASTVMSSQSGDFWTNLVAMAALFIVQGVLSRIRIRSDKVEDAMGNDPLLLMRDGRILHHNLVRGQITESDLMAKLREANALQLSRVRAVVLEATGDISVLHGDTPVDEKILQGIRS